MLLFPWNAKASSETSLSVFLIILLVQSLAQLLTEIKSYSELHILHPDHESFWRCISYADVLETCWRCLGDVLEMCWRCVGDALDVMSGYVLLDISTWCVPLLLRPGWDELVYPLHPSDGSSQAVLFISSSSCSSCPSQSVLSFKHWTLRYCRSLADECLRFWVICILNSLHIFCNLYFDHLNLLSEESRLKE